MCRKSIIIYFIIIFIFIFHSACSMHLNESSYPIIEYGYAVFSGKIENGDSIKSFSVTVTNPITLNIESYHVNIQKDGTFILNIPVVAKTFSGVVSPFYSGAICLAPNKETILTVCCDVNGKKNLSITNELGHSSNNLVELLDVMNDIIRNNSVTPISSNLTPKEYATEVMMQIQCIMNIVESYPNLSSEIKTVLKRELKLFYLDVALFDYSEVMGRKYNQQISFLDKSNIDYVNLQEPDKSYYSFLKEFNLNDPEYISVTFYPIVLQRILDKEVFNILPIANEAPEKWLNKVKDEMKELIGTDAGFFYDMLTSASYAQQLNHLKPFSDEQIAAIRSYFKSQPAFIEVLLMENEKVKLMLYTNPDTYHINSTPQFSGEALIDSIALKYKRKVIFVDFWATWCIPCIEAMKKAEIVKTKFKNDDVVFVYITNTTSPEKLWRKRLPQIGGEHFYLKKREWDELQDALGFMSIPTYLIINKNGVLKYKYTSFMGCEEMEALINSFLKESI